MKKLLCLMIAFGMVLTFGACTDPQNPTQTTAPAETGAAETTAASVTTEPAQLYDDSLLSELLMDETLPGDSGFHAVYKFPQILDDTPDAQAFNDRFAEIITAFRAGQAEYDRIQWTHYWNGPLVSFVLEQKLPGEEQHNYRAYTYDFSQGMLLENADLLSKLDISFDSALRMLFHAAEDAFDSAPAPQPGSGLDKIKNRAMTLSYRNLDLDRLPLYLGENNTLHAIAEIASPAGWNTRLEDLVLEPMDGPSMTAEGDHVKATMEDNRVTLVFTDPGDRGEALFGSRIAYDTEYPVSGLFGSYREMQIVQIGSDGDQYLCLLNDHGRVTVCNLTEGAFLGGSFCGMPLLGPSDPVTTMQRADHSEGGGYDFHFITDTGEWVDPLEELTVLMEIAMSDVWQQSWMVDKENDSYWIDIRSDGNGGLRFSLNNSEKTFAEGPVAYDGIDGYGVRFRVHTDPALGGEGGYVLAVDSPFRAMNPDDCLMYVFRIYGDSLGVLNEYNPTEFYQLP